MIDISAIQKAMQLKGHVVFENDSKPFNLNYVGIRDESAVNTFNDLFVMFWKYKGHWSSVFNVGTTDPGSYYLKNILNAQGAAILAYGQHRGAFTCGYHLQSKYGKAKPALVQLKDVDVIRDANRDNVLDLNNPTHTGKFGINHHRAMRDYEVEAIGRHSAGCQVRQNDDELEVAYRLWRETEENWGKGITYTILNINDIK